MGDSHKITTVSHWEIFNRFFKYWKYLGIIKLTHMFCHRLQSVDLIGEKNEPSDSASFLFQTLFIFVVPEITMKSFSQS